MRIAAYCRVSTKSDDQLESLRNQKEFFEQYASQNHHNLVRIYADEGISGKSLKKREQLQRLLFDAAKGEFEAVVVKDISRLARNTVDFLQSIRLLKSYGVNTIFINVNMESMGDSEFILTIFSAMAQEELRSLSSRIKFGVKQAMKRGSVMTLPYGYIRTSNTTLEVNEQEAAVVRQIFDLYVSHGYGQQRIANELNRQGVRTQFNHLWYSSGVSYILQNPIYAGVYVNHIGEVQDFMSGKYQLLPESEHYYHTRPEWAIITKELYDQAQQCRLQRRPKSTTKHSAKHLFSTIIRCEECGYAYKRKKVQHNGQIVFYWYCAPYLRNGFTGCCNNIRIDENELTEQLRTYLQQIIGDPQQFISTIEQRLPNDYINQTQHIDNLKKQLDDLKTKKDRVIELFSDGIITKNDVKQRLDTLMLQMQNVEQKLEQCKLLNPQDIMNRKHDIEKFLSLETMTNTDLKKIVDRITVSKTGEVKIFIK